MYRGLQHPEIDWAERTGYPSWMQDDEEDDDCGYDEDAAYEEQRDRSRGIIREECYD